MRICLRERKHPSSRTAGDIEDAVKWGQEGIQIGMLRDQPTERPGKSLLLLDEAGQFRSTIFHEIPAFALFRFQWFWSCCHEEAPFPFHFYQTKPITALHLERA